MTCRVCNALRGVSGRIWRGPFSRSGTLLLVDGRHAACAVVHRSKAHAAPKPGAIHRAEAGARSGTRPRTQEERGLALAKLKRRKTWDKSGMADYRAWLAEAGLTGPASISAVPLSDSVPTQIGDVELGSAQCGHEESSLHCASGDSLALRAFATSARLSIQRRAAGSVDSSVLSSAMGSLGPELEDGIAHLTNTFASFSITGSDLALTDAETPSGAASSQQVLKLEADTRRGLALHHIGRLLSPGTLSSTQQSLASPPSSLTSFSSEAPWERTLFQLAARGPKASRLELPAGGDAPPSAQKAGLPSLPQAGAAEGSGLQAQGGHKRARSVTPAHLSASITTSQSDEEAVQNLERLRQHFSRVVREALPERHPLQALVAEMRRQIPATAKSGMNAGPAPFLRPAPAFQHHGTHVDPLALTCLAAAPPGLHILQHVSATVVQATDMWILRVMLLREPGSEATSLFFSVSTLASGAVLAACTAAISPPGTSKVLGILTSPNTVQQAVVATASNVFIIDLTQLQIMPLPEKGHVHGLQVWQLCLDDSMSGERAVLQTPSDEPRGQADVCLPALSLAACTGPPGSAQMGLAVGHAGGAATVFILSRGGAGDAGSVEATVHSVQPPPQPPRHAQCSPHALSLQWLNEGQEHEPVILEATLPCGSTYTALVAPGRRPLRSHWLSLAPMPVIGLPPVPSQVLPAQSPTLAHTSGSLFGASVEDILLSSSDGLLSTSIPALGNAMPPKTQGGGASLEEAAVSTSSFPMRDIVPASHPEILAEEKLPRASLAPTLHTQWELQDSTSAGQTLHGPLQGSAQHLGASFFLADSLSSSSSADGVHGKAVTKADTAAT